MLSIGKLAAGGEGHYLEAVAAGVEDYYLGAGEAPGRWLAGAGALGLEGEVGPTTFEPSSPVGSRAENSSLPPRRPDARARLRPHVQRAEIGLAPRPGRTGGAVRGAGGARCGRRG